MISDKKVPLLDGLRIDQAHKGGKGGGSSGPSAAQIAADKAAERARWELDSAKSDYKSTSDTYDTAYNKWLKDSMRQHEVASRGGMGSLISAGSLGSSGDMSSEAKPTTSPSATFVDSMNNRAKPPSSTSATFVDSMNNRAKPAASPSSTSASSMNNIAATGISAIMNNRANPTTSSGGKGTAYLDIAKKASPGLGSSTSSGDMNNIAKPTTSAGSMNNIANPTTSTTMGSDGKTGGFVNPYANLKDKFSGATTTAEINAQTKGLKDAMNNFDADFNRPVEEVAIKDKKQFVKGGKKATPGFGLTNAEGALGTTAGSAMLGTI